MILMQTGMTVDRIFTSSPYARTGIWGPTGGRTMNVEAYYNGT